MENKLDKTSSSKETEIIQWPPKELEPAQIFAHWHCGSHTVFIHFSWSFTSFTSSVTKEKGSHRLPHVILLHLQRKDWASLAPHLWKRTWCFSGFPPAGCWPCQWYFRLRGLLSLGCHSLQVDEGRSCHGNWPLGWDTVQAPPHALKSFWKAFIDSCPNELISGLLLGYPLSLYKGSPISCRLKDCSGCFKVALSMLRFYKCPTTHEVSSSCSMNNIPDISLHNL